MPNKELLESYPLYRKCKVEGIPETLDKLGKVRIKMPCKSCGEAHTFSMINEYYQEFSHMNFPIHENQTLKLLYLCNHCEVYQRTFVVLITLNDNYAYISKIGQHPAWEIKGEAELERMLGDHSGYFGKGLISESQGYGIGAFAYYRRIVEEVIDELLNDISALMSGDELMLYNKALEKTKHTRVTAEKIELVKDLLPPILRPNGMNPLSALHSALSKGLHAESDEECLELAESSREVLIFLVKLIGESKKTSQKFTESMKKLLDKKANLGS